ncbi:acylphosphatase [uncultured Treponema sp.]|uniref:acylphosphatase n=1 Tax=uncultured Treponema sp. TaxID=162155 RepID=UPI0025D8FCF8|nr:acylphosphatase [uncultured Treponema sp.]
MENVIRQHFRFVGMVQGVGFRCTAQFDARGLGLSGWVKNKSDGSVELEAQGPEAKVAALIKQLKTDCFLNIDSIECRTVPVNPVEHGFRIRF